MQNGGEQSQVTLAECLCGCPVWICPAEAEEIHKRLQMIGGHTFQFSVADGVLLDTIDRTLIRHNCTVA